MEFKDHEAIYLQIAGYVCDHILLGKWPPEEKIPSVRELAVMLEVNPNPVMRTYELLQNQELIYNKRGIGFFVVVNAADKIKTLRKERFLEQDLPAFFKSISLLNIGMDEIEQQYQRFKSKNY
ncbi:MAG: GntR family transcriptional regulator [Sphingobacteriaceae bacterium]